MVSSLKIKINKIFLLFFFFLIIPRIQAIGSLQKSDFTEIEKNGIANFKILFWNTENISYPIKLEIRRKPENFFVLIEPKEFVLLPSKKGPPYEYDEYVSLPSGDFKVFPVDIYVKDFGESGEQEILISALIGSEKNQLTFLMEKIFSFKVRVSSSSQTQKVNESEPFFTTTNILSREKKIFDLKPIFYALIILVFITISILVYKHA